jgi:hypothetical protein
VKGLIIKDFLVLKKTGVIFIGVACLYAVMNIFMDMDMGPLMTFLCGMLAISTFAYDEQAKWDACALSMPLTKRDMVRGKYVMALLLGLFGVVLGMVVTAGRALTTGVVDWQGLLLTSAIALCGGVLFNSLTIPMLYKFGAEKSRLILIGCYALPLIGLSLVLNAMENAPDGAARIQALMDLAAWLLPLLTLAALALSYRISLGIFRRKDV